MKLFRERLLARLVERHTISEDLARKLAAWTQPGFSSHVAEAIPFENKTPDPGRHRTHFYAHHANRVRGERPGEEEPRHADEAEPPRRRRSSPTWARLMAKVFQADPLVCRRCGGPLKVVA